MRRASDGAVDARRRRPPRRTKPAHARFIHFAQAEVTTMLPPMLSCHARRRYSAQRQAADAFCRGSMLCHVAHTQCACAMMLYRRSTHH